MRLGLKIICEDWKIFVTCETNVGFFIKSNMAAASIRLPWQVAMTSCHDLTLGPSTGWPDKNDLFGGITMIKTVKNKNVRLQRCLIFSVSRTAVTWMTDVDVLGEPGYDLWPLWRERCVFVAVSFDQVHKTSFSGNHSPNTARLFAKHTPSSFLICHRIIQKERCFIYCVFPQILFRVFQSFWALAIKLTASKVNLWCCLMME